ncbi:MAG TPA: hypothetical protein VGB91_05910, partial [Rhizomicrobium sp.]
GGVIAIDFVTRKRRNTTPRPLKALEQGDPLGESVAAFVRAVQYGVPTLVRPQQARQALATALAVEDAAERALPAETYPAYAAAR